MQLTDVLRESFAQEADKRTRVPTWEQERQNRTVKPMVIIGLGGAGAGVAVRFKKKLHRHFRNMPEVTGMVQFLALDTEIQCQHRDPEVQNGFVADQEYLFLGGFNPFAWYENNKDHDADLRQWWPQTTTLPGVLIQNGCQRLRPMGRLCLHYHRNTVEAAISTAITNALTLNERLINDGRLPPLGQEAAISVYVISGSCGGTGSGMLLDVLTMVRRALAVAAPAGAQTAAIIAMPTFYRRLGQDVTPRLMRARGANGYAFLRELQYFYLHPEQWADHCMDAQSRRAERADRTQDMELPANAVYVLDDEVAGRVIPSQFDLYTLAADSLYNRLVLPVSAATVDLNQHINQTVRDRPRAFSSTGVSYVIYPRKTLARCAGAAILRDILDTHLLRPISDAERSAAEQDAKRIFDGHSALLNGEVVARELEAATASLRQSIPTADGIRKEAARPIATKPRLTNAMRNAQRTAAGCRDQALRAISARSAEISKQAPGKLTEVLQAEVLALSRDRGLEYALAVVSRLKDLMELVQPAIPAGQNRASAAEDSGARTLDYVTEMERFETNLKPDLLERRPMNECVEAFARDLGRQFAAAVDEAAARSAREYGTSVVKPLLEEVIARCVSIRQSLTELRNAFAALAEEKNIEQDEENLPLTTQLLPVGGVDAAVTDLLRTIGPQVAGLSQGSVQELGRDRVLWNLGDPNKQVRAEAQRAGGQRLVEWICQQTQLDALLRKNLTDVISDNVGIQWFKEHILPAALDLADPTWRVDPNVVGGGLDVEKITLLSRPADAPQDLFNAAGLQDQPGSIEPHRMMVLKLEHGLPLYALSGMATLRQDYEAHLAADRNGREPPHIHNAWMADPCPLEDIFPQGQAARELAFALGLFTNWLVRDKKHEKACGIVRNWEYGIVYERTPGQYYVAILAKRQRHIEVAEERHLAGGRAQAAAAFAQNDQESVQLFMERLSAAVGADGVRDLISEYCTTKLEPLTHPRATTTQHEQYQAELQVLRQYIEQ